MKEDGKISKFWIIPLIVLLGVCSFLAGAYIRKLVDPGYSKAAKTVIYTNISGGSLSDLAPETIAMSDIDLDTVDSSGAVSNGIISGVKIQDHRSASPGWSLSITCDNFVDEESNLIPVTNLTITPGAISPVGASSLNGISAGSKRAFGSTIDPIILMSAAAGNGMGRFLQDVGLSLSVDISTVPGSYSSVCTETVA
ncbi:WxL domain-containing protein [Patescibacteria group bacterium]|nr:WxL domain-containing protein [Patescibacteria group bacterium]